MLIKIALYGFFFMLGNFVYQYFMSVPDWESAFERSYFQLMAYIQVIGLLYLDSRGML